MDRMLSTFLIGAAGGAVMAFLIVALTKVLVLDPQSGVDDAVRLQGQIDTLQARVERLELGSGQFNAADARRMGAPRDDAS